MKKIFDKKILFSFVLGILVCGGIVYGVNTYESETIQYSPTDSSWTVNNVSDALNDLYLNKNMEMIKNSSATSNTSITIPDGVSNGYLIVSVITTMSSNISTQLSGTGYKNGEIMDSYYVSVDDHRKMYTVIYKVNVVENNIINISSLNHYEGLVGIGAIFVY